MADRGRIPLTLVGGFLGAGKSTWLRHQLHERRFGRTCVIVNEAAGTPVDDLMLGGADRLLVLAGGCACCTGRDALIATLRQVCNEMDGTDRPGFDHLVLETSGLADPAAIAGAIAEDAVLGWRLAIGDCIVLVDAVCGLQQLMAEPLARAQTEAASRIVVTKVLEEPVESLSRLAATLKRLNPSAEMTLSERGQTIALALDPAAEPCPLAELSPEDEPIRAHRLNVSQSGGWVVFTAWLSALLSAHGARIVRVKGVIRAPAGPLLIQSVRDRVQPPEMLPESVERRQDDDVIVLIGRGIDPLRIERSWHRCRQGSTPA